MTISNMSIEWGARAGLSRRTRPRSPTSRTGPTRRRVTTGTRRVDYWRTLPTDPDAVFDQEIMLDASRVTPFVTWGTNPGQGAPLDGVGARPAGVRRRRRGRRGPAGAGVHGPAPGHPAARRGRRRGVRRLLHQRAAGGPARGRRRAARPPGGRRRTDARRARLGQGPRGGRGRGAGQDLRRRRSRMALRRLLDVPGHEPRHAQAPGQRAASTSNRNFEGRQGRGGRTHLVSPPVAAATAVVGRLASPADLLER